MDFQNVPSEEALNHFTTSIEGLTEGEAQERLATYGPNEIRHKSGISPIKIFLSQFNSFIVYILIAAVVISFILHEYIDSAVIIAILIVNAVLGFIQEYRAEKAVESLLSRARAAFRATFLALTRSLETELP